MCARGVGHRPLCMLFRKDSRVFFCAVRRSGSTPQRKHKHFHVRTQTVLDLFERDEVSSPTPFERGNGDGRVGRATPRRVVGMLTEQEAESFARAKKKKKVHGKAFVLVSYFRQLVLTSRRVAYVDLVRTWLFFSFPPARRGPKKNQRRNSPRGRNEASGAASSGRGAKKTTLSGNARGRGR